MRGVIVVETQEEYDAWMAGKKPQYLVANPDKDPSVKKDTAERRCSRYRQQLSVNY